MKKLLFSLTILSTIFVGCSTDDDETTIQPVEGELTADIITANKINSAQYPSTLDDDIQIEIDPTNGSDDVELADGAVYKTIAGALTTGKCDSLNSSVISIFVMNLAKYLISNIFLSL